MQAANKVALNTGILYGRMLFTMAVSLYATRLVLNALGSTDYGIFNLVAGVIAMLSFLNAAMTTSTQRYLSYYQGKQDIAMQRKVFTNSLLLHLIIGLVLVAVLEICSLFLFNGFLNIPADRIHDARIIYHFMSATVFFTVLAVPFNGSLVAHENMLWVAIVNIAESLFKLVIAVLLLFISSDKLVVYGLLTSAVSIVSFILYAIFCFRKYEECTLVNVWKGDKKLIKELGSFAGWNLFGSLCFLGRTQGLAVLLNVFFGAIINAAYGIANQVAAQLSFFSATMLRAVNPQIMKSEGAGNRDRMLRLSMMASKFGFFLMAMVAIPCIFEMQQILQFWLKKVPEHTVVFCNLILIGTLINQLTIGLQSAIQATGRIKVYQAIVGSVILFNLPVAYIMLRMGLPAYMVLVSYAAIETIACALRIYFLKKIAGMSVGVYFEKVFLREVIPVLTIVLCCYLTTVYLHGRYRFLLTGGIAVSVFCVTIYLFGLVKEEKELVNSLFDKVKGKIAKRYERLSAHF